MPFDAVPGGYWDEYFSGPSCKSCKRPIAPSEERSEVRFDPDPVHRLDEINGTYHVECARPFLSMARALQMLNRPLMG